MDYNIAFGVFKEQFFENLPYKIMWMDEAGKIIYANKNFLIRLGYSPKEVEKLTILPLAQIKKAHQRIKKVTAETSLDFNRTFSEKLKASISFKREDLQPVRSYKLRGASN